VNLPIRVRLTVWYAVLLTATIVALAAFLVVQLRRDLTLAVDTELTNASTVLIHALGDMDAAASGDRSDIADEDEDFLEAARAALPSSSSAVQLLSMDGDVLAEYGVVTAGEPLAGKAPRTDAVARFATVLTNEVGPQPEPYRIHLVPVHHHGRAMLLLVAASLTGVDQMVQRVLTLLLIAGPAALLATAVSGFWLAGKALRPVERMTSDAQGIGAGALHERVDVPSPADELRNLALTLNAMLARIEDGANKQRRLVADVSHELRSPLAVMRTEIDVSLRGDELPDAAREVLESAGEEVDRMRRTVDNLLTLAASDEGRLPHDDPSIGFDWTAFPEIK